MHVNARGAPRRLLRSIFAAGLTLAALAVVPAGASAAPVGALSQLSPLNANGCISTNGSDGGTAGICGTHAQLDNPVSMAISPDGNQAYVASSGDNLDFNGGLLIYNRNKTTGQLTPAGCFNSGGTNSCTSGRELMNPVGVVVSPDGKFVYVASFSSGDFARKNPSSKVNLLGESGVAIFVRNADGSLSQSTDTTDPSVCINNDAAGPDFCQVGHGLADLAGLTVSSTHVYTAGGSGSSTTGFGNVGVLSRSGSTLTQASDTTGCLQQDGVDDNCTYASFISNGSSPRGIIGLDSIAVSPDGTAVYGGARENALVGIGGLFENGALSIFSVDGSGNLSQAGNPTSCIAEENFIATGYADCGKGHGLGGLTGLAVSPDSKNVYTAAESPNLDLLNISISGGLGVFAKDSSTGIVSQLGDQAACFDQNGDDSCSVGRAQNNALQVAVSPDGKNVYATSGDRSGYHEFGDNSIVNYSRDSGTGALTQLASTAGCVEQGSGAARNCSGASGLREPNSLAVTPDGEHVYAGGLDSSNELGVLTAFNRTDLPPACQNITQAAARNPAPTPVALQCADPDSNPMLFSIVGGPTHGTLSGLNPATGAVSYTPNAGFSGTDTFTYRSTDQIGQNGDEQSNVATVTLTIPAVVAPSKVGKPTLHISGVHGGCSPSKFHLKLTANGKGSTPNITVFLDGKRVKKSKTTHLNLLIRTGKLHGGQHHLRIVVKGKGGTRTRSVSFTVCRHGAKARFTG